MKLVKLRPIKTTGNIKTENKDMPAIFLGREKLEVLESSGEYDEYEDGAGGMNRITICDVVPIPIQSLDQSNYIAKMLLRSKSKNQQLLTSTTEATVDKTSCMAAASILFNRDSGIFDNLPFEWGDRADARKQLYSFLSGGYGSCGANDEMLTMNKVNYTNIRSPEAIFLYALDKFLNCSIVGLILEVKDELGKNSVSLGAATVVAKRGFESEYRISTKQVGLPDETNDLRSAEACVINCHTDELVLLSIATNIPIYMPKSLFLGAAVDVSLDKDSDGNVLMNYDMKSQKRSYRRDQDNSAVPAWEIFDPMEFIRMSSLDKRAVLRASGVSDLPRPREGLYALETQLLDLMDDAVRGEFLRIQASKGKARSDFKGREGTPSYNGNSDRQSLLQAMCEALQEGEIKRAEELRDRFAMLTALKQDHTQEEGSYDKFLDQDEWYMEARRKAMAPKREK